MSINGLWLLVIGLWLALGWVMSGLAKLTDWVILGSCWVLGLPPFLPLSLADSAFE